MITSKLGPRRIAVGALPAAIAVIAYMNAQREEDRRRREEWMFEASEPAWRAWVSDNF